MKKCEACGGEMKVMEDGSHKCEGCEEKATETPTA